MARAAWLAGMGRIDRKKFGTRVADGEELPVVEELKICRCGYRAVRIAGIWQASL